jgi:hypothetical protein
MFDSEGFAIAIAIADGDRGPVTVREDDEDGDAFRSRDQRAVRAVGEADPNVAFVEPPSTDLL